MAAITKSFLRSRRGTAEISRRKPINTDATINSSSETDGPLVNEPKGRADNKDMIKDFMVPSIILLVSRVDK